ncbi:hypothetical protein [Thalassovita sp.]|uniref:hypothetical protein n=1 Tax=Thalassovita sp. TaxID=1979401 RepID=UPI003B5C2C28
MALYSTGTVTVTNGSTTVQGSGTAWFGALQAGWMFIGPDGRTIGIADVVDNDTLTLTKPYLGSSASGQQYECFPTMSLAGDLATAFQGISADFQGMIDGVGEGKFPDGSAAVPGVRFESDTDTGVRRVSSNKGALVAGGNDVLTFASSGISGTGVQTNGADAAAKVLKAGAANLLLDDGTALTVENATGTNSLDALRKSGFWRYLSDTVGAPSSTGLALHLCRLGGIESAGRHIQIAFSHSGPIYHRYMNDSAGGWSGWSSVLSSDLIGQLPELRLNGSAIGGGMIAVANDGVATITPPRKGGFLLLTDGGASDYPQQRTSAFIYFDVGNSLVAEMSGGFTTTGLDVDVTHTVDPTGTSGTAGRVLVAAVANAIKIENRSGSTKTFNATFL